ncbi:MAG TPA: hypothetical protein VK280_22125 [Streptosporangiaceae bacterium]|nr:hypothetical protein [Streptosporangiaceae bacterium]
MYDNDNPDDSAVLSAVHDSISGLPMPSAPHLEAITARGRARRRRRLGGLSMAGAGACAALVAGLAGGPGPAGPAPRHEAPPVHLAAFSVVAGADGTTTLTLYPGQVANPAAVRRALAEHGIPALVTAGRFCRTADQPPPGVGQVVVLPQRPLQAIGRPGPMRAGGPGPMRAGGPGPVVIYGSAIPHGVELSIGYRQDPQNREISFTLIQAGAPLTCTSIPDNGPHGVD